ncbi:unnamed protein product [Ilex paraguariensis]|uniref:O-acyltransferase WSD1 C-terminal domain-containing protein n=1 Tax=Ilex paraguariensis TaxID=185542 RepID=A0ABC8SH16_9AQUA
MCKLNKTLQTINDVLFGVVSSGLSKYLDLRTPKALREGLQMTGLAMVNLRPQSGLQDLSKLMRSNSATRWGNKFEAFFSYKIGYLVMSCLGPKFACMLNYRILCNTTFTISNVLGPREEITIAANPITYIRANTSSLPHAITMHMLSYAGRADMQILVAKEIIPDPEVLASCFEEALLELKKAAETATKT